MASESEVRRYMVQTPGDGEEDWVISLPLLLTILHHGHSLQSLSGLRIPSTSCALEQGNANNIKAFYLGVAFFAIGLSPLIIVT